MSEMREILGQWWLPSASDNKWLGTLTLEPSESPRLKVTVTEAYFHPPEPQESPVLHGHDDHGKPITLLFPGRPTTQGAAVLSQMDFTAGYAVLGLHLGDAKAFAVHSLSFGMQHLYEWSGISGFIGEDHATSLETRIHYKRPEDQVFSISPDLSMEVCASNSGKTTISKRILQEDTYLRFQSPPALSLAECNKLITAARHLLHFAVLKPVYPTWISGGRTDHGSNFDGRFIPHGIEIVSSILRDRVEPEIHPERWIFRLSDVRADFARFFGDWLKFCERFEEPLSCYSTTVYHRLPNSVHFLCLAQTLEAYHGIKSAKMNFKARIRELTSQFLPHLGNLVQTADTFAEQIRVNRNYYTHHDSKIKQAGGVLSGGDLYRLSEKLQLLFQMCVLTELGIHPDRFARLSRQLATLIIDYD